MGRITWDRKTLTIGGVVAALAVFALWRGLRDDGSGETDPALRRVAKMEAKADVDALAAVARSGSAAESARALAGLASVGSGPRRGTANWEAIERARAAIRGSIADPRPEVRAAAARALGAVSATPADVGELRTALAKDPAPDVRRAAANAIGEMLSWDGTTELVAALDDADPLVRQSAYTAVFRITGTKFKYDADGNRDERRVAMAQIRRELPRIKPAHDDYLRRLRGG
jgi:HEAT repeat protein